MSGASRVGDLMVAPGDGDLSGGMIYIESLECQRWISFQVEHADAMISAIRKARDRIMNGAPRFQPGRERG